MKRYVMFNLSIVSMGGGQMYAKNKLNYMKRQGYCVALVSAMKGEVMIPDLKRYYDLVFPELISSPTVYSEKQREKILAKIIGKLNAFFSAEDKNNGAETEEERENAKAEVLIESGSPQTALWGELVAERLQGKHFVFLISERNDKYVMKGYLPFYGFKLKRGELAGIADCSLTDIFAGTDVKIKAGENKLSAVCTNVVEDYDAPALNLIPEKGEAYNLCCIGRLDKPYVFAAAEGFICLAENNADKKFNFIFIGDGVNGKNKKKIKKAFIGVKNATAITTGSVYPLPEKLFERIDLFVSSTGSAYSSYREGAPTVSVDGKDLKAIGVLGWTTSNYLHRDGEEKVEIADLCERVLFDGLLDNLTFTPAVKTGEDTLKTHTEFLEKSEKKQDYYPVGNLSPSGKDVKKRKLTKFLGVKGYLILHRVITGLKRGKE